ncbi:OR67A protein, partial [Acromyrmex insinuator]
MDFQNVNPLNVRLNMISGNLLPMTADNSSFPIFWKIYSILIWLLEILQTCVLIPGCFFVPKEKALKDAWSSQPFMLVFQRNSFFYIDYKMPVVYTKEPITTSMFVFGSVIVMMSSVYIFTKKVGADSYIINLLLLVTAQYKYIALKLSMIFQDKFLQNDHSKSDTEKCYLNRDDYAEKEIKVLCRHHNTVIQIMLMLRKLLSLNISLIYVISVFRFCCISLMINSIPSETLWEICSVIMYGIGGVVQLYIMCSCMQQLLDASVNITEYAFHEKWYQYGKNMKRTFMFMIMANNLEIKLSTFEKYNLSLSSFMTILNQSYSIAILLLKTN